MVVNSPDSPAGAAHPLVGRFSAGKRATLAAMVVLVIAGVTWYGAAALRGIASAAVKEALSQVQKQSSSRFRMSEIAVRLPDKVALLNVAVWFGDGAEPPKDAPPDFAAKEIVITYGLRQAVLDFLQGKSPSLSGLGSVTLVEPRVRVRKKDDGTWNFDKLLSGLGLKGNRKSAGATAFRGSISIKDGNLVVVAPELKALGGTALGMPANDPGSTDTVTVEQLKCDLYFTRYPLVVGSASARHVESGIGLSLDASYDTEKGKLQGSLSVSSVDVGFLSELGIAKLGELELRGGKIDAVIKFDGDLTEGFRIWIEGASKATPTAYRPPGAGATTREGEGPGLSTGPLTQAKGPFLSGARPGEPSLSITSLTATADATFRLSGEVRPKGLDEGTGQWLGARVEAVRWSAQAVIRDGAAYFAGLRRPVENVRGRLRLTGRDLELLDVTGRYGDCSVQASGRLTLGTGVGGDRTGRNEGGGRIGQVGGMDLVVRLGGLDLEELLESVGSTGPTVGSRGLQMSGKADVVFRVKGEADSPEVSGEAEVEEASVIYKSIACPYEHVRARVSFVGPVLRIKQADGRLGASSASVTGTVRLGDTIQVNLRVKSPEISTRDIGPVVMGAPRGTRLRAEGTFTSVDMTASGPSDALTYSGSVGLKGGTLTFSGPDAVIREAEGQVVFTPDHVTISAGTGTLDGTRLSVTGDVGYGEATSLDLSVSSDAFGFELLGRFFPSLATSGVEVGGRGRFTAAIKGDLPRPAVSFEARPEAVTYRGFVLERPEITGRYAMGSLCVDRLEAGFAGGRAVGSGVVPEATGAGAGAGTEAYFSADLSGVEARRIAAALGISEGMVSGLFTGKVAFGMRSGRVSCVVEGDAQDGSVAAVPFAAAKADFSYEAGEVRLNSVVLEGGGSRIAVMGRATTAGEMDLEVTAKAVDVAALAAALTGSGTRRLPTTVSGRADFSGGLHGSFESPTLSGLVDITSGAVGGLAFRRLAGQVTASFDGVALNDVRIWQAQSSFRLTGTIVPQTTRMDLAVTCEGADVGEMLSLVGLKANVAGSVSGRVTLRGTVGALLAEGKLAMTRGGTLFGQRVDSADMAFRLTGTDLEVEGFAADIGGSTIYAAGKVAGGQNAALRVWAKDLDLERMTALLPEGARVPLVGRVDFNGLVEGPLTAPCVRGRVSSEKALVFDIPYGPIDGEFTYEGRLLSIAGVTLRDDQGSVTVSGEADLASTGLNLTVLLDRARLDRMLALARGRLKLPPVSGEVYGEVAVGGTLDRPTARGSVTLASARVGSSRLERVEVAGELRSGGFKVDRLVAAQGSGRLTARGEGSSGGALSVEATATGFDVGALAPVLGLPAGSSGVVDLAIKVTGTARSPVGWVTLDIRGGRIGKVLFDRIAASASYERGMLFIESATATQGKHRAEVSGTIPVDPGSLELLGVDVPESEPRYDLTVRMDPADLSLLCLATDAIKSADGSGRMVLAVTGPRTNPEVRGSVAVADGRVLVAGIADPLTNVSGVIEFTGNEAVLNGVSCRYRGQPITIEGKARMEGLSVAEVSLAGRVKGLRVEDPRLAATVDADVTLTGPASMPTLAGNVKLSKTSVGLASIGTAALPALNVNLDLNVELGSDTGIRSPDIDVDLRGGVRLSGTAREPQAEGRIEARRGYINYLGTEFKIEEASAEFEPPQGIVPTLDVRASARVKDTLIYLTFIGKATEPIMDVYSVPPLSREEILVLLDYPGALNKLLHGDVEGILEEELVSMLDRQVRFQVISGIERAFKEVLSLDEFRLERGEGEEMVLRIGKLWDKLYLSYATTIGPREPESTLKFEYLYSPYLFLGGTFGEQGEFTVGAEARFRF